MTSFTPLESLIGGMLIGLAASWMLLVHGRVAGISGIYGPLLQPRPGDMAWRMAFVAGLVVAGVAAGIGVPHLLTGPTSRSIEWVALAGLLVGFGVRLGNGCTSGHGVCGLSRLSPRSLVAVLTFMATGVAAATVMRWAGGGA